MRKQYYFRPSTRGLLAWDVDRLITLSIDLPRLQVPLDAIQELTEPFSSEFDHGSSWRAIIEHIRLVKAADSRFPIVLAADGRVMDGMHRVIKALLAGKATIEAVQFRIDPEPDHVGIHPDELSYAETHG
jgi:hypothetical protein